MSSQQASSFVRLCVCLAAKRLTDVDLADVGKLCTRLTTFYISGCRNLQVVARKCRILRLLKMSAVREVSNRKVHDLSAMCPALHTVAMAECDQVAADAPAGPGGLFTPREAGLRHVWRSVLLRVQPAGRVVFGDTKRVQRLFRAVAVQRLLRKQQMRAVELPVQGWRPGEVECAVKTLSSKFSRTKQRNVFIPSVGRSLCLVCSVQSSALFLEPP